MAIQDFTAGQVLTATQMDNLQANDYNQTVSTKTASYTLVAADKGTRVVMNAAGATTITVNTSLFSAGDTLYLQNIGAGVCTVTAGTATVSSAGPLAIPQYGSGTLYFTSAGVSIFFPSAGPAASSGLTLVSSTTIGTTVSSVTVSNAFSATYDNYLVILAGGLASSTPNIDLTFGATSTGYYYNNAYQTFGSGSVTTETGANASSVVRVGNGRPDGLSSIIQIQQPNIAGRTLFQYQNIAVATGGTNVSGGGYLDNATSYTAFTLTVSSGTITGGTIKVYGYANS